MKSPTFRCGPCQQFDFFTQHNLAAVSLHILFLVLYINVYIHIAECLLFMPKIHLISLKCKTWHKSNKIFGRISLRMYKCIHVKLPFGRVLCVPFVFHIVFVLIFIFHISFHFIVDCLLVLLLYLFVLASARVSVWSASHITQSYMTLANGKTVRR